MKIQLINVGRGKVNKTVEIKNETELQTEIGHHLMSKGWELLETDDPETFDIIAGIRHVGQIKKLSS